MKNQLLLRLAFLAAVMLFPMVTGNGCDRGGPYRLSELFSADLIVRATADKYIILPDPVLRTTGVPDSTVEFKIEETIRGVDVPNTIVLNGYLTDKDDYNETPLPYKFVRPGGRAGSCFANSYKKAAQFLLFLKRSGSGYTVNFSALGPTNEQLHSPDDPWVKWVKAYLAPCARQGDAGLDYGDFSKLDFELFMTQTRPDLEKYRIAKCYVARFGTATDEASFYSKLIEHYETTPRN
jgi:hypothetical protein